MLNLRGLLAVVFMAALLSVPISLYWEKLTKGMQPSESTLVLNRLETKGMPDMAFETMAGEKVTLKQFLGKVVVLNVWATWCAPCVKEFPSLQRLVQAMAGKLVVVAVSQDSSREDIDYFVKAFGSTPDGFMLVWDKDKVTGKALGTDVLPETYILGPDGKLVRKVAGETTWDDPMAIQFFKDILEPQPR